MAHPPLPKCHPHLYLSATRATPRPRGVRLPRLLIDSAIAGDAGGLAGLIVAWAGIVGINVAHAWQNRRG